ncbi:FAD/NAD(P)-binding protein [Patiriisocius marinus]|nr:FAD/NAD(P)-binding protein [Patiriisocius marinus]
MQVFVIKGQLLYTTNQYQMIQIAIIGFGPRGLACLENIILEVSNQSKSNELQLYVFEPSKNLGTGKAWNIDQPKTNYINISDHALQNLKGRETIHFNDVEIPSFPSYTQWCLENNKVEKTDGNKDFYPPRSQMGNYLNERSNSICAILIKNDILTVYREKVISIINKNDFQIINTIERAVKVQECLLTLGHTSTRDSEETKLFKEHSTNNDVQYIHNPYETTFVQDDMSNTVVAIKGFGLSMLDITRQLTNYKFGNFKEKENSNYLEFCAEKGCVSKIVPYSFDGLPCVPKPYGRIVDDLFKPSIQQLNTFELFLRNALSQPENCENLDFIITPFSEIVTELFIKISDTNCSEDEINYVAKKWLGDMKTTHRLVLDTKLPTVDYMRKTVEMARGTIKPSLDFTIGQVWRHVQPTLYRLFAFSGIRGELMKDVVDLDQSTKRYSYGPPLESILQLIALSEASILDLNYVSDPKVTTVSNGWKIENEFENNKEVIAGMMCNSVMDSPILKEFDSPIFDSLKKQNLITSVVNDLGVATRPDATMISPQDNDEVVSISVVGRNAKGSVLGTDAILECFSPETQDWAKGIVSRRF